MQKRTNLLDVDFSPVHAGEVFADDRYYQRYSFTAHAVGKWNREAQWVWDFGDGRKSTRAAVDHVYVADGMYTVTLTAKYPRGTLKRTNRIYVSRPWDKVTQRKLDKESDYAAIVASYDFATLDPESAGPAFELLKRSKRKTAMIRSCVAFLNRKTLPAASVRAMVPTTSELLLETGQPEKAVKLLLVAADRCDSPEVSARMTLLAAGIALNALGDDKEAMKLYTRAATKYGKKITPTTDRDAQIGIGDVWRVRGDYDKSAAAYKTAGYGPEASGKKPPIVRGDFSRHVESYTQDPSDYEWAQEYLQRWSRTFPADKLDGYLSLLSARLWMVQGKYAEVTVEADIIARVNPASNYGAQLLKLAADAYRKMDKPDKALAALKRIVDKFPESPLAVEAADALKKK